MRRPVTFLVSTVLSVSVLVPNIASNLQAQDDQQCSVEIFQGTYGFLGAGFFQGTPPNAASAASRPIARLGIVTADGAGNFSVAITQSNNGIIQSLPTAPGTYSINSDCTGAAVTAAGITDLVFVDKGKKILLLTTNPGAVRSAIARRIDVVPCSVDTLQGTYGILAEGFFQFGATTASQPFTQIGQISFDGVGNAVGQFAFSANGTITSNFTQAFTYAVDPDCTGTITVLSPGTGTGSFVIVGNGKEFLFLQTVTGTVVSATGMKQ